MPITARTKIKYPSNKLFNDPVFRSKLEKHIDLLKARAKLATPDKAPSLLAQENDRGDFRMVLKEYGTPMHLHWLIMRINDIIDPFTWDFLKEGILLIDESDQMLQGLITLHYTNK